MASHHRHLSQSLAEQRRLHHSQPPYPPSLASTPAPPPAPRPMITLGRPRELRPDMQSADFVTDRLLLGS